MPEKFYFIAVFLIATLTTPAPAAALTLPDVLAYVCAHNPTLLAAQAELHATDELYPQALAGWRPTVSAESSLFKTAISSNDPAEEGTGAATKEFTLSVDEPIYRGGRTAAETARAQSLIQAADARYLQTEEDVLLRAATAYIDLFQNIILLNLNHDNETRLSQELQAAQERFHGGDVTTTDVKQAQLRLARAQADRIASEQALEDSRSAFEEAVGKAPAGTLTWPGTVFDLPADRDTMLARIQTDNPAIRAAQKRRDAALDDIDSAYGDLLPQLSAFASVDQQYDPQPGLTDHARIATVGMRARLALYQGGILQSHVREQKDTAAQREHDITAVIWSVQEDVITHWRDLIAARTEIDVRHDQITAAQAARDGVSEEARLGERTVLDVLDADQELLNAQASLIRARRNETVSTYALAAGLGLLLPEKMGMPDTAYDPAPHLAAVRRKIFSLKPD